MPEIEMGTIPQIIETSRAQEKVRETVSATPLVLQSNPLPHVSVCVLYELYAYGVYA